MTVYQARNLARYHKFTKGELHQILKDALENLPESYWKKPCVVNKIFDNGYHFNRCVEWIGYSEDNRGEVAKELVTIRVLQTFSKFSKVQIPKKKKVDQKIQVSEKPKL